MNRCLRMLRLFVVTIASLLIFPHGDSVHAELHPPDRAARVQRREAARNLASRIDHHVQQRWSEEGVVPADPATDVEFLRRVYLDLAGKIPTASDARRFLRDPASDKRARLVERLLNEPTFVTHFAQVWTDLLIPEARTDVQLRYVAQEFRAWFMKKLDEGTGYDEIAREILTVPLPRNAGNNAYAFYSSRQEARPTAFFAAKQVQPESLAAATARVFMGLRVDCAQCHDHPFADWTQEQFWSYAAFFSGIRRESNQPFGALVELFQFQDPNQLEIGIPETNKSVRAKFLDGTRPTNLASGPRQALAVWLLERDNPYFARAAANRMWAIFFGIGLVDPVDDLDPANPASHPELLNELASALADNDFDLRVLIQAIALSRPYQLTSKLSDPSQHDVRLFARVVPKSLSPEQVYHSLQQALGRPIPRPGPGANVPAVDSVEAGFRELFERSEERSSEGQTSVLQALAMMNGSLISQGTNLKESGTLAAIAEMPWLTNDQKIESLFFAAVSRPPTPAELDRLRPYVESGGASDDAKEALADIFWALLNSSEFLLNH